jgi:LacI family transcriptional regulator
VVLNSQDRAGRVPSVAPDEVRGGYAATSRLIKAGHSKVGMINIESLESGLPAAVGRYEGYCAAMQEAGLDVNPALVRFGTGGEEDGYKYAMELLTSGNPPGLTTFELPFVAMGRRAVELILQDAEPDGRVELMDCPLIERNSVTHPKEMP